ncbi:hypothetical protein AB1Y20_018506 [Prymnesium parvum]|uniref:Methyltransferase domain-containing protein n=1 Tax=Prymnesium parvum TaxID=97485 RepID=A0AB34JSI4_PRYPA
MAPRLSVLRAALHCRSFHRAAAASLLLLGALGYALLGSRILHSPAAAPSAQRLWEALRPTSCDGFPIPARASIGELRGQPIPLLRTLTHRDRLPDLANDLNLTGRAVELGVFRGEFAEANLKTWRGRRYYLVDLWAATDCVGGDGGACVYSNGSRSYDKRTAELRMARLGERGRGRFELVQASTTDAASRFADGFFDWIYLDATHTYAAARQDILTWWPKLRVGGLFSGHDYQFQHQTIGQGYTFGVRDAVDEFASQRNIRVYSTMESYLPSSISSSAPSKIGALRGWGLLCAPS